MTFTQVIIFAIDCYNYVINSEISGINSFKRVDDHVIIYH